jgi:hypothetical protein
MKTLRNLSTIAAIALAVNLAQADVTVLDFEGVGHGNSVGNFYNGGAGGNLGIQFSGNALGLVDADAGGTGNFGGEPSPDTVLYFVEGAQATMNVFAGFTTGFSFYYSSPFYLGSVTVWDGLNGTGNLLATLTLPYTPNNGQPDPNGIYSPFVPFGVTFTGTAMSVDFAGTANYIAFDNITLGSETPGNSVPDSGSTALMVLGGLVSLAGLARRKL